MTGNERQESNFFKNYYFVVPHNPLEELFWSTSERRCHRMLVFHEPRNIKNELFFQFFS